jgi:hypothetical protein
MHISALVARGRKVCRLSDSPVQRLAGGDLGALDGGVGNFPIFCVPEVYKKTQSKTPDPVYEILQFIYF